MILAHKSQRHSLVTTLELIDRQMIMSMLRVEEGTLVSNRYQWPPQFQEALMVYEYWKTWIHASLRGVVLRNEVTQKAKQKIRG